MIYTLDRSQIQEPSINSKSTDPPKKRKIKRRCDIVDILERQKEEFSEKLENLHKEKMARFDRFLDLYEREIDTKGKQQ